MTRIYTPQALSPGEQLTLERQAGVHLVKVLRMRSGDEATLFNGDGFDYRARIDETGKSATLTVLEKSENHCESNFQITLAQGICRSDRMDYALQKSVELGVAAIQPLLTEKSSVKLDEARLEKKLNHWRSVVISAVEQSGRSYLPKVLTPRDLPEWLSKLPSTQSTVALEPTAEKRLRECQMDKSCCLLVGPESGFSANELTAISKAEISLARLGPRILRTETTAVAAIASLQTIAGDF